MEDRDLAKMLKWIVGTVIVIVGFLVLNPIVIVSPGERGVVITMGAVQSVVLDEGLHFRTPFVQSVAILDVRMQKEEVQTGAASKDLQVLNTTIALNYHLDEGTVPMLYQKIGTNYKVRVIDPAVQEAVKAATAKYTAEEAITKRSDVREDIKKILTERLAREYIKVDEVSITDFDFSKSFNDAIEAKVTAEQQALQAKNVLEQKKFEAEQIVVTAKANAESIKVQSEAANNEKYVALKALEVQSEAVKKWNGQLPTSMIPGGSLPFVNVNSDNNTKR
jgi:regulator of protease activity HflC (stomatin/prohibitin superfamily)